MTVRNIPIGEVVVGPRLREVDGKHVESLMETIREVGLLNPVTVGERGEGGFPLVAGAHRLEACRRLGWAEIDASVVTLSELQRRLAECDENLAGTVLSTAQRAHFTAIRKEVYLALHPETANGGDRRGPERQLGDLKSDSDDNGLAEKKRDDAFTADTARKTGRSRRSVEREAKRGAAIQPEVLEAVAGTELDTGRNLDKLAKLAPEVQLRIAEHLRDGNSIAARVTLNTTDPPKPPDGSNVVIHPKSMTKEVRIEMARLHRAWDGACEETQIRFLRRLEKRGVKVPPGAYPPGASRSGS